ncbi:MAG TPA: ATP-binding protein, partial [Nevskiaceae bacterium]|nr:ATP-binding protein [Nevskiaceae bacterium]
PVSGARSGLFLAAPRRTGKTTFVREDLREALIGAGCSFVYIDLWEDRATDPARLITAALGRHLQEHKGLVQRLRGHLRQASVTVAGVSVAMEGDTADRVISIGDALAALSDQVSKPLVLVIDEAQQALATAPGENVLFALKAARDALNATDGPGLRIVATGSNRDKLALLVSDKAQAFYGAALIPFPALGRPFVAWFCEQAALDGLSADEVWPIFERSGYRPEILFNAADAVRFDLLAATGSLQARFDAAATEVMRHADDGWRRAIAALTPMQRAVLTVMVQQRDAYAPFDATTRECYETAAKAWICGLDVPPFDNSNVQAALRGLQGKGLVWKAARGVYSPEDPAIGRCLASSGH